jgi:hypothetical protein
LKAGKGAHWGSVSKRFYIFTVTRYCGRPSFLHVTRSRRGSDFGRAAHLVAGGGLVAWLVAWMVAWLVASDLFLQDMLVWRGFLELPYDQQ